MEERIDRRTGETDISLSLDLYPGDSSIDVPCGFLRHMLELLAHHAGWTLKIRAAGDLDVDAHHLTEDLGIVLGQALLKLAGTESRTRYGWCALPMDGTLVLASVDLSGRGQFCGSLDFPSPSCGGYDMELIGEFWTALAREGRLTLHLRTLAVDNSHHLAEATFKAAGRTLRQALAPADQSPSTKGTWL